MPSSATTEAALSVIEAAYRRHFPDADFRVVETAHRLAEKAHRGQLRKSGDPYITHPVAVTEILAEYGLDATTLAASLLHDTVEDTSLSLAHIKKQFGCDHSQDGGGDGSRRAGAADETR
jgi:GTP pyrophosphokinase